MTIASRISYPGSHVGILFRQTLNVGNKIRHPARVGICFNGAPGFSPIHPVNHYNSVARQRQD